MESSPSLESGWALQLAWLTNDSKSNTVSTSSAGVLEGGVPCRRLNYLWDTASARTRVTSFRCQWFTLNEPNQKPLKRESLENLACFRAWQYTVGDWKGSVGLWADWKTTAQFHSSLWNSYHITGMRSIALACYDSRGVVFHPKDRHWLSQLCLGDFDL